MRLRALPEGQKEEDQTDRIVVRRNSFGRPIEGLMALSDGTQKSTVSSPRAEAPRGVGIKWDATAIRSSAPPVRIVGSSRRYRGGFRLNV